MSDLKIESHKLTRIKEFRMAFAVTVYEDEEGTHSYMATAADAGMTVGVGETPYQAVQELCETLDNLPDEDVEW